MWFNLRGRILKLEKKNFEMEKRLANLEEQIRELERANMHLLRIFQSSMEKMQKGSYKRFIKIYKN